MAGLTDLSFVNRVSTFKNPLAVPPWIVSPNGGQVFYLCSLGVQDATQEDIARRLSTTLSAALNQCRANRGDVIIALPGHAENVTTTPTWVAGVTVVGIGNGDERPTFTWTATTSQWAFTVANVAIHNCILNLAGTAATATTKAIVYTAAGGSIRGCQVTAGAAGGTQLATIGIELGTGASRTVFADNRVYAPADAAVVSMFKTAAAVDACQWTGNVIDVGMSATAVGVITMSTAPTNVLISRNVFRNSITNSTKCLVGVSGATGQVEYNTGYITAATGGATAFGTLGSMALTENYGSAGAAVTGILIGTSSS